MHVVSSPGPSTPSGNTSHVIPLTVSSAIVTAPVSVTVPLLLTLYRYSISAPTLTYVDGGSIARLNPRSWSTSVLTLAVSSALSSAAAAVAVFSTCPASTSPCVTVYSPLSSQLSPIANTPHCFPSVSISRSLIATALSGTFPLFVTVAA